MHLRVLRWFWRSLVCHTKLALDDSHQSYSRFPTSGGEASSSQWKSAFPQWPRPSTSTPHSPPSSNPPSLQCWNAHPHHPERRQEQTCCSLAGARSRLAWRISRRFLPWQADEERQFYSLQYNCLPPPLFIPILVLLQVRPPSSLCLGEEERVRLVLSGLPLRVLRVGAAESDGARPHRLPPHLPLRQARAVLAIPPLRPPTRRVRPLTHHSE